MFEKKIREDVITREMAQHDLFKRKFKNCHEARQFLGQDKSGFQKPRDRITQNRMCALIFP